MTTASRVRRSDGPKGNRPADDTTRPALDALTGVLRGLRAPAARGVTPMQRVADLARLVEAAEAARDEAVFEARAAGLSWTQLAVPLGISKQATAKRYAGQEAAR